MVYSIGFPVSNSWTSFIISARTGGTGIAPWIGWTSTATGAVRDGHAHHVRGQRDDGLLVIPRNVEKLRLTNKFIAFTHLWGCHKFLKSSHSHEDHEDYITFCIYVSGKVFSWFLQHPLPNIHHRHAGLEAPAQALTWYDLITNRVFWYLK